MKCNYLGLRREDRTNLDGNTNGRDREEQSVQSVDEIESLVHSDEQEEEGEESDGAQPRQRVKDMSPAGTWQTNLKL